MEELLTAALKGSAALTALIGGADAPRIYWDVAPKGKALPCVIVHEIPHDGDVIHLEGKSGISEWFVQIDCWAGTAAEARAVRRVLLAADGPIESLRTPPLQAFGRRRHTGSGPAEGPDAQRSTSLFRASLDVQLWHTAA